LEWVKLAQVIHRDQGGMYCLGELESSNGEHSDSGKGTLDGQGGGSDIDAIISAIEKHFRLSAMLDLDDEPRNELIKALKTIKVMAKDPVFNGGESD
jgi:hypothetical protein